MRRIDRLILVFNILNEDNEAQRVWESVKTNRCLCYNAWTK